MSELAVLTKTVKIDITARDLAVAFEEMDVAAKVDFFNRLPGLIDSDAFYTQIFTVADRVSDDALHVMKTFGDVADKILEMRDGDVTVKMLFPNENAEDKG